MGSRFDALDLPEDLRQWHALGLKQVFGSLPEGEGADAEAPASAEAVHEPAAPRPASKPAERAARPRPDQTPRHNEPAPHQPDVVPEPVAAGPWPAPWDAFLQKVCVPSKTVWTYWELTADLCGQADPARRQLWANMVKALSWPRGCIAFWPLAELQGGSTLARADLFWRGVREIGAAKVLCFGRRAFMTLFPDRQYRLTTIRKKDLEIIVLPEIEQLTGGEMQAKRHVWATLSALRLD